MRIALTGHSKGIGAEISHQLELLGHTVVGFSRSNGWDITNQETRQELVAEIEHGDYDCFINNAYPHKFYQHMEGFAQVELLNEVWLKWEKQDKVIVVLGSYLAESTVKNYYYPLGVHKRALNDTCLQLRNTRALPHIINVKPNYVDTQLTKHLPNVDKMSTIDVAEMVVFALTHKLRIHEIQFSSPINNKTKE
jgi:hypothetical protein